MQLAFIEDQAAYVEIENQLWQTGIRYAIHGLQRMPCLCKQVSMTYMINSL